MSKSDTNLVSFLSFIYGGSYQKEEIKNIILEKEP